MTDADSIMTSRMATIAIVVGVAASVLVATRTIAPTSSPSSAVLFQVLGLGINVITVSIPGRFDSDVEATSNMAFPWPTLLAPAGYAFAIWGVIYVGEVMGLLVLLFGHTQEPHPTFPLSNSGAAPPSTASLGRCPYSMRHPPQTTRGTVPCGWVGAALDGVVGARAHMST